MPIRVLRFHPLSGARFGKKLFFNLDRFIILAQGNTKKFVIIAVKVTIQAQIFNLGRGEALQSHSAKKITLSYSSCLLKLTSAFSHPHHLYIDEYRSLMSKLADMHTDSLAYITPLKQAMTKKLRR